MNIETIEWEGFTWRKRFVWGEYHPEYPYMWYSPEASYLKFNELHLNCIPRPKLVSTKPPTAATYGVGMVESLETFGYGTYISEILCPYGKNLWPAFWLTGKEDWPPEIDVFECWNNYKWWDILNLRKRWYKSSIHVGSKKETIKPKAPKLFPSAKFWKINGWNLMPKDINQKFYTWKLIYTPNKINIYFDNNLIYKADKARLNHPSLQGNPPMSVVFSLLVGQDSTNVKTYSPLRIKNFKYYPLPTN